MTNSVKAYIAYKKKRKELQAAHKEMIEAELLPWAKDLGEAILLDRANGMSMEDVAKVLNNRNRNMLYAMVKLAKPDAIPTKPEPETKTEPEPDEIDYSIEYSDSGIATVTVFHPEYSVYRFWPEDRVDGVIVAPDEWANGSSDERKVYKRILGELNG